MRVVQVLILGAGGQAKVVADAILAGACDPRFPDLRFSVAGFLDSGDGSRVGAEHFGFSVPATRNDLGRWAGKADFALFPARGEADLRLAAIDLAAKHGLMLPVLRHPAAVVARGAILGDGTFLAAGSVVGPDAKIGRCCIVNTGAGVDHDCVLADGVHVAVGARLAGNVSVGEGTLIGAGAVVRPGVRIGRDALVAMGAAVVRDVPDGATVGGVPAKPLG